MTLLAKVEEAGDPAVPVGLALPYRCNIGEMPRKVQVKCAIAGCHRRQKVTLAEREELRRVGRENNATAGLICPAHVKASFNFEFDDIDVAVPLGGPIYSAPQVLRPETACCAKMGFILLAKWPVHMDIE